MNAVIYARYSSDRQREESIEGQLRECTEYANKNNLTLIGSYVDRALSARIDDRPDFQRMIADSAKGVFEVVLVWKLDRFSRDRYDSAHYKHILKKNGVRLISAKENISDGPEGIILESMLEGYAEYYSAELSQKIRRGQQDNARKCISSLIGTGGRDLYPEIGGIMMLEGIRRLERDPDTKIIILVSKLADLTVMNKDLSFADIVSKPVVAIFLGADEKLYEGHRVYGTYSLEGAAVKAAQLLGAKTHDFGFTDEQIKEIVAREMCGYSAKQKYFRGLYCGGTFTEEGLIYYSSHVKNARLHSNLNTAYAEKLASHLHSEGHSILDLGSEEFTACSPHPVFDPEIRLKRFRQELQDDEVAVILLDFITGPGVAKEPVKEFAIEAKKAIAEKHITVISNICGSAEDPQNIELQAKMLRDAGVIVTDSNYQSARLAAALMSALNERG